MEYDCYQHYFFNDFDTEEDFYNSCAPSEDIWKKFELLPSPPTSPPQTLESGDCNVGWLSRVLAQEDECEIQRPVPNISSIIIQDCMWSSFSTSKALEKVMHGKQSAPPQPPAARPGSQSLAKPSRSFGFSAADFVDPEDVLAYPTISCRKTASSGSDSRTDSSVVRTQKNKKSLVAQHTTKKEDEEEEEEIDVVTVESKHNQAQLASVHKPVNLTVPADPFPKSFHALVHQQQHNYAARSPDTKPDAHDDDDDDEDEDDLEEFQSKRTSPASSRPISPSGSSLNSDMEDVDRRKNHNYLERKRRNDLKSRFLALRDQIPGLESTKTPKVAILTHATEYLKELHTKENQQQQERKRLKARKHHLLRRLAALKRL
ncbi:protein L-Myc-1b-like isoform X2 [Syngnathus typhle]|uniref:protein L-Myc-1b-like isoform X2 n=1 Tax=Syngnathus typhle TaxID=161592 RepID=UPI002A69901A|nr:protein L-Myc-1b-like isoform X2 [Syngnathus typhle]